MIKFVGAFAVYNQSVKGYKFNTMNKIILLDIAYDIVCASNHKNRSEVLELLNELILDEGVNEEAVLFNANK